MPTLNWIGKEKVVTHHNDVPYRVLDHKYNYGTPSPTSTENGEADNMIIHGDNLEALKALLPKYEGQVDCIYIDPPYNTGNEKWVYNDNVNDPHIRKWLGQVVGPEAEDLTRHDKWLCMMYPRLVLLQKLLAPTGAIFISIDDNEQANLKLICDEIFGAGNFVGTLSWESTTQPINAGKAKFNLQKRVEYIFLYKFGEKSFILKELESQCKYPHNGKLGKCRYEIIEKSDAGGDARQTMKFPILGKYPREGKRWQIGESTAKELIASNRIEIINGIVRKIVYPEDELDKRKFEPFWSHFSSKIGTAQSGKDLLNFIFGTAVGFDTVKPPLLIETLLQHFNPNALILDSFAGSGTTAHAVLNLNKQDGGHRRFILCEMCDYAETITAERVRRVIDGYGEGNKAVEGTGGSFAYYELGTTIFDPKTNLLNDKADTEQIREYVWYSETHTAYRRPDKHANKYLLGQYEHNNYYFYYEPNTETCLDWDFLNTLTEQDKADMYIIYADRCLLSEQDMTRFNIRYKKIPRDIKRV